MLVVPGIVGELGLPKGDTPIDMYPLLETCMGVCSLCKNHSQ